MKERQKLEIIKTEDLIGRCRAFFDKDYRLVQMSCTKTDVIELNYSFDKKFELETIRIILKSNEEAVPSISKIYWSAFLYENEMHDLYGINIENIALDYKGKFYNTAVKYPFAQK